MRLLYKDGHKTHYAFRRASYLSLCVVQHANFPKRGFPPPPSPSRRPSVKDQYSMHDPAANEFFQIVTAVDIRRKPKKLLQWLWRNLIFLNEQLRVKPICASHLLLLFFFFSAIEARNSQFKSVLSLRHWPTGRLFILRTNEDRVCTYVSNFLYTHSQLALDLVSQHFYFILIVSAPFSPSWVFFLLSPQRRRKALVTICESQFHSDAVGQTYQICNWRRDQWQPSYHLMVSRKFCFRVSLWER